MNDNELQNNNSTSIYKATRNLNTEIENPEININSAVGINIQDLNENNQPINNTTNNYFNENINQTTNEVSFINQNTNNNSINQNNTYIPNNNENYNIK